MKNKIKNVLSKFGKYFYLRFTSNIELLKNSKEIIANHGYSVVECQFTYNKDGLATMHNADFIKDNLFQQSYQLGKKTGSWGLGENSDVEWRAYVACWSALQVKNLEGDFVECGVNRGGLSRTIINYINFNSLKKTFYLLDTFNGLVDSFITETERKNGISTGGYQECYEDVKKTFEPFNVKIVRGAIPETLSEVKTDKICYLSIDMNCVMPEIKAIEYFWDKVVIGGIVLLDDYGWPGHIEQKKGFDLFAREKNIEILSLPTGQGLIVKIQ